MARRWMPWHWTFAQRFATASKIQSWVAPNFRRRRKPTRCFVFTDLGGAKDVNGWLGEQRRAVAGLLSETAAEKLSEPQVNEVLRIQRSFENTDLVVIDWDAALVVDLTGYVDDVLYALELANLQLEEFRMMDQRLDKYLDRAYDDLERRPMPLFGAANKTLRHLRRFRVDVAKLTDEVHAHHKILWRLVSRRVYLARATVFTWINGARAWSSGWPSSTSFTASSTRR